MILVAIGANLPSPDGTGPLATCQAAAEALGRIAGLRLEAVSCWYRTEPVPPSGQPPYINGVVRLSGRIAPESLLAALHAIESSQGRARAQINAARTLDLDVVAMDAPDGMSEPSDAARRAWALVAGLAIPVPPVVAAGQGSLVRARPDPVVPHPRAHGRSFVLAPLRDVAPDWVHPVLGRTVGSLLAQAGLDGVERLP